MEKITGEFFLGKMLGFRVELFLARSSMTVTSIVDEVVVSNRGKTRSSWRRLFGKGTRKSRDVRRSKADDYRIPSDSFCRGHVVSSAELVIWFVDAISRHIQSRMIGLDPCLDFVASSSSSIFFVKINVYLENIIGGNGKYYWLNREFYLRGSKYSRFIVILFSADKWSVTGGPQAKANSNISSVNF